MMTERAKESAQVEETHCEDYEEPLGGENSSKKKKRQKKRKQSKPSVVDKNDDTASQQELESSFFDLVIKNGTVLTPMSAMSTDEWFEEMYNSQHSRCSSLPPPSDDELVAAFDDLELRFEEDMARLSNETEDRVGPAATKREMRKKTSQKTKQSSNPEDDVEAESNICPASEPLMTFDSNRLHMPSPGNSQLAHHTDEDLTKVDDWLEIVYQANMLNARGDELLIDSPGDPQPERSGRCQNAPLGLTGSAVGVTEDQVSPKDNESQMLESAQDLPSELHEDWVAHDFELDIAEHVSLVRSCMTREEHLTTPEKCGGKPKLKIENKPKKTKAKKLPKQSTRRMQHQQKFLTTSNESSKSKTVSSHSLDKHIDTVLMELPSFLHPDDAVEIASVQSGISSTATPSAWKRRQSLRRGWRNFIEDTTSPELKRREKLRCEWTKFIKKKRKNSTVPRLQPPPPTPTQVEVVIEPSRAQEVKSDAVKQDVRVPKVAPSPDEAHLISKETRKGSSRNLQMDQSARKSRRVGPRAEGDKRGKLVRQKTVKHLVPVDQEAPPKVKKEPSTRQLELLASQAQQLITHSPKDEKMKKEVSVPKLQKSSSSKLGRGGPQPTDALQAEELKRERSTSRLQQEPPVCKKHPRVTQDRSRSREPTKKASSADLRNQQSRQEQPVAEQDSKPRRSKKSVRVTQDPPPMQQPLVRRLSQDPPGADPPGARAARKGPSLPKRANSVDTALKERQQMKERQQPETATITSEEGHKKSARLRRRLSIAESKPPSSGLNRRK